MPHHCLLVTRSFGCSAAGFWSSLFRQQAHVKREVSLTPCRFCLGTMSSRHRGRFLPLQEKPQHFWSSTHLAGHKAANISDVFHWCSELHQVLFGCRRPRRCLCRFRCRVQHRRAQRFEKTGEHACGGTGVLRLRFWLCSAAARASRRCVPKRTAPSAAGSVGIKGLGLIAPPAGIAVSCLLLCCASMRNSHV